jgi:hypothetical protein
MEEWQTWAVCLGEQSIENLNFELGSVRQLFQL